MGLSLHIYMHVFNIAKPMFFVKSLCGTEIFRNGESFVVCVGPVLFYLLLFQGRA